MIYDWMKCLYNSFLKRVILVLDLMKKNDRGWHTCAVFFTACKISLPEWCHACNLKFSHLGLLFWRDDGACEKVKKRKDTVKNYTCILLGEEAATLQVACCFEKWVVVEFCHLTQQHDTFHSLLFNNNATGTNAIGQKCMRQKNRSWNYIGQVCVIGYILMIHANPVKLSLLVTG